MKKIVFIGIFAFLAIFSMYSYSSVGLKSVEEEYFDYLSLNGITIRPTFEYRTLSDNYWSFTQDPNTEHTWNENTLGTTFDLINLSNIPDNFFTNGFAHTISLNVYGPEWFNSFNSYCPYGQNDGVLWQGKGYNTSFTAGARLEAFGFELTLKPMISFSQNLEFVLYKDGGLDNPYSYIWGYNWGGGIDLPQRFGNDSFFAFDWGDSEIRYSWYSLTMGFGTQSPWIGPAWLNPMLGSNNAPSYPKFDIGMRRQKVVIPGINWDIGDIEGRLWIGYLSESQYFDTDESNNHNLLAGFSAAYSPSFIPGLTIGLCKVSLTKWGLDFIRFLNPFYSRNGEAEDLVDDQKMCISIDWLFPEVGFEFYGEFGKDDYSANIFQNPFHTGIYTIGFKKTIVPKSLENIGFELICELNNFEMSQDFQSQWPYMGYYAHFKVTQGYTNNGQLLGAGSGYFGNSQYLGFKAYYPKGSTTVYIHRSCPDNNYIYNKDITEDESSEKVWWSSFKTFVVPGVESSFYVLPNLLLTGKVEAGIIIAPEYYNSTERYAFNFHGEFGIKWAL